jgi:hypothetical protein
MQETINCQAPKAVEGLKGALNWEQEDCNAILYFRRN